MLIYQCLDTGVIEEIQLPCFPYDFPTAQFCSAKRYSLLYQQERHRFAKMLTPMYALPFHQIPEKEYHGMDRQGAEYFNDLILTDAQDEFLEVWQLDKEAVDYELLYVRLSGETNAVPEGWELLGFDVGYPPCDAKGAFSIICDCMFLPRWHGCDESGTEFLPEFYSLNAHGLFRTWQEAYDYMVHYLRQDWSERGEFGVFEIYRKIETILYEKTDKGA